MRKALTLIFLAVFAGHSTPLLTAAQDALVQEQVRLEKEFQSDRELRPSSALADPIYGQVSPFTPRYKRVFSNSSADPECGMESLISEFDPVPYAEIFISVTETENLEAHVVASGTDIEDTVLALYCEPFDPKNPQENLLAYDDDDGEGRLSAFSTSDGVTLHPGERYWLVISSFRLPTRLHWDFEIVLSSPTVDTPVELQTFTIE